MSKGMNEKASMKGEEYLEGRRAGQEGTHGEKRKGTAEKTIYPATGASSEGGGEDGLAAAARGIYQKAVKNEGDSIGDKALTKR